MDETYLLAALERATAHQNRALAALGHPLSRMGNGVDAAAPSEDLDASESRAASANEPAAPQAPDPSPGHAESRDGLRESDAPGVQ